MASQIDISGINANFPVAGTDNSSQGFRDNFTNIKLALTTATDEISDLQLYSAKTNITNDFGFTGVISRAKIKNSGFVSYNDTLNTSSIDYTEGNYHKVSINTNTTFSVNKTTWPSTGIYSQMRLEINPTSTATININFNAGSGTLLKDSTITLPYSSTSTGSTIWDLHTTDQGDRVFLKFVGGPFV